MPECVARGRVVAAQCQWRRYSHATGDAILPVYAQHGFALSQLRYDDELRVFCPWEGAGQCHYPAHGCGAGIVGCGWRVGGLIYCTYRATGASIDAVRSQPVLSDAAFGAGSVGLGMEDIPDSAQAWRMEVNGRKSDDQERNAEVDSRSVLTWYFGGCRS